MFCPGWQKWHGRFCPGQQKWHGEFCPGCHKMAWDVLSRDVLSYILFSLKLDIITPTYKALYFIRLALLYIPADLVSNGSKN